MLTDIKKNTSMWEMPGGEVVCSIVFNPGFQGNAGKNSIKAKYGKTGSGAASGFLRGIGAKQLEGFQLRYIFFIDPTARERLTVPILPFSEIDKRGAGMYRGKQRIQSRAGGDTTDTPVFQTGEGGSTPTSALQSK